MNRKQRLNRLKSKLSNSLLKSTTSGTVESIIKITLSKSTSNTVESINRPKSIINNIFNLKNRDLKGNLQLTKIENKTHDLRSTLEDKDLLGIIVISNNNQSNVFLSATDLKDIFKDIKQSPNASLESKDLNITRRYSLICLLSWIEVELVSDTL